MTISRRWFIGSMASAVAAARFDAFAAAWKGVPRLKFGVVSDIHVTRPGKPGDTYAYGSGTTFRHALEWFRDQGVDAVVCAGDMADRGTLANLEVVGGIWRSVFPGNKAPDGRHVEPVFLYGNHDADFGWFKNASGLLRNKSPEEAEQLLASCIASTRAESWRKAFGEEYADVYLKWVKGYAFVCAHWGCEGKLAAFLAGHKDELAGSKPFFYAQHPHPGGTVYGARAWGNDGGVATKALAAFPNAVAFSGHSHTPLALAQTIWQGAFTSIGASSLSYLDTLADAKCLNCKPAWNAKDKTPPAFMAMADDRSREGMLVTVCDGFIKIDCREFVKDEPLCAVRVLPLPYDPAKAYYSFENQMARLPAPAFPANARATCRRKVAGNGVEHVVVEFPSAVCSMKGARVAWYAMSVFEKAGDKPVFAAKVSAVDYFSNVARIPPTATIAFPSGRLPNGKAYRYEVRAIDLFDRESKPLAGEIA